MADTTPTLGKCCVTGYLDSGTPIGAESKLGSIDTYVTPAEAATGSSAGAILFITDVFGWQLVNARLVADQIAAQSGIPVFVPDLHGGKSLSAANFEPLLEKSTGFFDSVVKGFKIMGNLPDAIFWMRSHGDAVTIPLLQGVVAALRAERGVQRLATIGYCWGGRYAALAGMPGKDGQPRLADVVGLAHPSGLSAAEVALIQVPTVFVLAGTDMMFSKATLEACKKIGEQHAAAAGGPEFAFREFEGCDHGFAVRGNEKDPVIKAARLAAVETAAAFFKKHLPK